MISRSTTPTASTGTTCASRPSRLRSTLLLALLFHRAPGRRRRRTQEGFSLAVVLLVFLTVVLGSAALVARTTLGNQGSLSQAQSREAREVAEAGITTVVSELNKEQNRKMLVSTVPLSTWSTGDVGLRNPCSPTTPTATAVGFTAANNVAGDATRRFRLLSVELKNADRSRRFLSTASGTNSNTTPLAYNDGLINLSAPGNIGYIALTVEGTFRGATATVTREFQVLPKCCGRSFGSGEPAHGIDTRDCDASFPRLLVGLNGGGFNDPGNAAELRLLDNAGTTTNSKPSRVLCITSNASCPGSRTTGNNVDGVPVVPVGITLPALPAYPGNQTNAISILAISSCQTSSQSIDGRTCNSTSSTSDRNLANAKDYLRVNSSGQVQLCNTTNTNPNTSQTTGGNGEPILSTAFVSGSCDSAINNFCVSTDTGTANVAYHCRINQLTVSDDTVNTDENNRKQNNTFVIDTSRGPIYLYFNQAWSTGSGVDLVDNWDDGQIQHVRCVTPPADTSACATKALPDDTPRTALYSDRAGTVSIGDDGFLRDVFTYFPNGTLVLNPDPDSSNNAFGLPNFRGSAWLNTLTMGNNTRPNNTTQIAVPPVSSTFYGLGNSANSPFSLLIFDWGIRSSSSTSLF